MPCFENVVYGPAAKADPLNTTTNVQFPNSGKHKLSSKVVYAEDGIQTLWYENTFEIETVIYSQTSITPADIETEIARLRGILSTPSLQLVLYPVGLGTILTVNVQQPDVKGGPFPQVVEVHPLVSNNAIVIKWVVQFFTVDCPGSPLSVPLLEYTAGNSMDVDDDGNMSFNYDYTYRTKDPLTDLTELDDLAGILVRNTDRAFQGMRRSTSTKQSRDQRHSTVRVSYTDIPSDNAFFPNTKNISVTDELESELMPSGRGGIGKGGFYSWTRKIGGKIRLPPRVHKTWAWIVFLKILRERFKNIAPATKVAAIIGEQQPPQQENDANVQSSYFYLPTHIKIKNPIYTREMEFHVGYLVVTDLETLIETTKICDRVNISYDDDGDPETTDPAKTLSEQWKEWQDSNDRHLTGWYRYNLADTPIVFNQCSGEAEPPSLGGNVEGAPLEEDPSLDIAADETAANAAYPTLTGEILEPDPEYSWVAYDNDFEIIENNNNVTVSFLTNPTANYYQTTGPQAAVAGRSQTGMKLHGRLASSGNVAPNNIARGGSTFFVRMRGFAIRVGHKIPIPSIVSVAGRTAERVGQARISQKQIATSDVPVYLAMWEIVYAVEGDIYSSDILSTIVTSGAPGHYQ